MRKKVISKEEIVEAAARVFSEKGLENATVEDIAKEAGIAKGSIYLRFQSRDEILLEGVRYFARERVEFLGRLLEKYDSITSKLHALLRANQIMAKNSPDLFFMNYSLLISTHKDIKKSVAKEFFKIYLAFVERLIEEGIRSRELKVKNAKAAALIFVVSQDMANLFQEVDPEDFDFGDISSFIMGLFK